jgi:hypothetical protein
MRSLARSTWSRRIRPAEGQLKKVLEKNPKDLEARLGWRCLHDRQDAKRAEANTRRSRRRRRGASWRMPRLSALYLNRKQPTRPRRSGQLEAGFPAPLADLLLSSRSRSGRTGSTPPWPCSQRIREIHRRLFLQLLGSLCSQEDPAGADRHSRCHPAYEKIVEKHPSSGAVNDLPTCSANTAAKR